MTETIPLPHGLNAILVPRQPQCPICGLTAPTLIRQHFCPTCTALVEDGHPDAIELANQVHGRNP